MTPLKTENLDLDFNDNIVQMRVSGPIADDSLTAGLDWIDSFQENFESDPESHDNYALRVDMPKDEFEDLGEINRQFQKVGRVLRHAKSADKCALLTDSMFIRNTAKVESAVIPGLEIRTFALDETKIAERWLSDKPLMQHFDETPSVADEVVSDNPWDNLKVKNLAL